MWLNRLAAPRSLVASVQVRSRPEAALALRRWRVSDGRGAAEDQAGGFASSSPRKGMSPAKHLVELGWICVTGFGARRAASSSQSARSAYIGHNRDAALIGAGGAAHSHRQIHDFGPTAGVCKDDREPLARVLARATD